MSRTDRPVLEFLEDRCTPSLFGSPWPDRHLTVSFVPDGTQIIPPGVDPAGLVTGGVRSNLSAALGATISPSVWQQEMLRALQTWAAQTNLNITVVPDDGQPLGTPGAVQGDVRFADLRIA